MIKNKKRINLIKTRMLLVTLMGYLFTYVCATIYSLNCHEGAMLGTICSVHP